MQQLKGGEAKGTGVKGKLKRHSNRTECNESSDDNESGFSNIGNHFVQFTFHHFKGQLGQQRGELRWNKKRERKRIREKVEKRQKRKRHGERDGQKMVDGQKRK